LIPAAVGKSKSCVDFHDLHSTGRPLPQTLVAEKKAYLAASNRRF
jgi:hypothetical protein